MTEYEYRNRLNAETMKRTYLQRQLDLCRDENRILKNRIDFMQRKIAELQDTVLQTLNSQGSASEEYRNEVYRLVRENRALKELVEQYRNRTKE